MCRSWDCQIILGRNGNLSRKIKLENKISSFPCEGNILWQIGFSETVFLWEKKPGSTTHKHDMMPTRWGCYQQVGKRMVWQRRYMPAVVDGKNNEFSTSRNANFHIASTFNHDFGPKSCLVNSIGGHISCEKRTVIEGRTVSMMNSTLHSPTYSDGFQHVSHQVTNLSHTVTYWSLVDSTGLRQTLVESTRLQWSPGAK